MSESRKLPSRVEVNLTQRVVDLETKLSGLQIRFFTLEKALENKNNVETRDVEKALGRNA